MMGELAVFKTNKGRYSVRPIEWEGIWDKYGRIQETGLNHIAIFSEKEDAEFFVKSKEAEEQGKYIKPVYFDIIEEIPDYFCNIPKKSKRKIEELMKDYGYGEDEFYISDDFLKGFGVARYIIIKMLYERYWKSKKEGEKK